MTINKHGHTIALFITLLLHSLLLIALCHLYIERSNHKPLLTEVMVMPSELKKIESNKTGVSELKDSQERELVNKGEVIPLKQTQTITPSKSIPTKLDSKPKAKSKSNKPIATPPQPSLHTQSHEKSLPVAEVKQQTKDALLQQEVERKNAEEQVKKKIEAEQRATAQVADAFGLATKTAAQKSGNVTGLGTDTGKAVGSSSHTLAGRSISSNGGVLTSPNIQKAVRGKINVRIVVDATGKVISAEVTPSGTNIADAEVRASALAAARKTEFNPQPGATPQKGIITYSFEIQ